MKLFDNPLSGNCYRVRLLLKQLGVNYEKVNVDIFKGENRTDEFNKINPNKKVPVLVDGDLILWESIAIMLYLAEKYRPNPYYSEDPAKLGEIMQWVAYAKTSIDPNLALSRYYVRFLPENKYDKKSLENFQSNGMNTLSIIEDHLAEHDFLAGEYSIADMACYPYIKLSPEGNINLSPYPNIVEWLGRVENTLHFIPIY